jgi:predicted lipid-binding transport protein (Tim44 family)
MSKWLFVLAITVLSSAMVVNDVEAKRLGGSRSAGTQRSITNAPPASTPAKPAQPQGAPGAQQNMAQQAAPAAGAAGAAAKAAPAATGLAKWAPMLGGLALGGMLGYLFSGSGMGGILLLLLLGVVAVLAFRAFARRRTEAAPQRMHYAGGLGSETVAAPPPSQSAGFERPVVATGTSGVPAGFDAAGFVRAAKMNFVRLQVANDAGNLEEIRDFTTPQMFDELKKDVADRASTQQTDVVSVNADLLEVGTEGDKHWASVRFSGMICETPGTAPVGFEEVWNLVKPADGSSGWLLAGIQQMQ